MLYCFLKSFWIAALIVPAHALASRLYFSQIARLRSFIAALIIFACVPFLVLVSVVTRKKMRQAFTERRTSNAVINATLESSITGIRVTKAYTNAELELEKFKKGDEAFVGASGRAYSAMAKFHSSTSFITDVFNVFILIAGGLFAGIAGVLIGIPVLRLRGDYLAIVTLAFGEIIRNLLNCIYFSVEGISLNFSFLNPNLPGKLLINGPMGATGIKKLATFPMGFVLVLITLMRRKDACQLQLRRMRIHKRVLKKIVRIGLPAGIQSSLFAISNVMIQSSVNSFGEVVVAANSAGGNLEGFVYTAMNAIHQAALTFASQNLGAGKIRRVRRSVGVCLLTVLVIGLTLSGILVFFGDKLLLIYASGENRDLIVQAGVQRLQIIAATYFLCGLMDVGCGILRGMGRAVQPMIVSLLGSCVFRIIWVFTVCPLFPGQIMALYISYPISWIVTGGVHFLFCVYFYKRLMKRKKQAEQTAATA